MPLPTQCPTPQILTSHKLSMTKSVHIAPRREGLSRETLLRVVSWNINARGPGRAKRASAAMDHVQKLFGDPPPPLVIMLQEVHDQSLESILAHPWIRKHFVLRNLDPHGGYSNLKLYPPRDFFSIILISQNIRAGNWLRIPLQSSLGENALVVDLPVDFVEDRYAYPLKFLRLCTAYLKSGESSEQRHTQLSQISTLLKAAPTPYVEIVGGLVGVSMYPFGILDAGVHKSSDVDLRDVWEDMAPSSSPPLQPFQEDLTYGRARGNTWGYQSTDKILHPRRLDRFLYTEAIDTAALTEVQDLSGKVGRFGLGARTSCAVLEYEAPLKAIGKVKGEWVVRPSVTYYDPSELSNPRRRTFFETGRCELKTMDMWVSDHFGIAIGIKVR